MSSSLNGVSVVPKTEYKPEVIARCAPFRTEIYLLHVISGAKHTGHVVKEVNEWFVFLARV